MCEPESGWTPVSTDGSVQPSAASSGGARSVEHPSIPLLLFLFECTLIFHIVTLMFSPFPAQTPTS